MTSVTLGRHFNFYFIHMSSFTGNFDQQYWEGGIRSTMVARWTADQKVKRSILHQGHDSQQNSSDYLRLSTAQFNFTVQHCGLKQQSNLSNNIHYYDFNRR